MSKKTSFLISIALVAVFILPACLRQASQVPQPTSTSSTSPFNMARPTGGLIQIYGTQTALAMSTQPLSSPNAMTPLPSPTATFGFPLLTPITTLPPTGIPGTPATPTTGIIVPTATPGRPSSYTLQPGEYPYCIARRFNVNQQELLTLNNLTDGQLLQAGTVLKIPQTGNPFVGNRARNPHPTTYTVSDPEQTIYGVACNFGDVDPTSIAAANSLVPPYTLHVGQVLNIP
jgi:LysM repeat protein